MVFSSFQVDEERVHKKCGEGQKPEVQNVSSEHLLISSDH